MRKHYKLDTNNHSAFKLNYHLILTVKHRRKVLTKAIEKEIVADFEKMAPNYHIELIEAGSDKDHIHFLFSAWPNTQLSKFINAYKSASSRLLKKEFPQIRKKLWKEYFWSQSFCLLTAGGAPLEIIKKYIETQGER